jgi:hypothetical protein
MKKLIDTLKQTWHKYHVSGCNFLLRQKRNLKARKNAKPYNIWTNKVDTNNDGYWLYDNCLWYGNRWLVFFFSNQNAWFNEDEAKNYFR